MDIISSSIKWKVEKNELPTWNFTSVTYTQTSNTVNFAPKFWISIFAVSMQLHVAHFIEGPYMHKYSKWSAVSSQKKIIIITTCMKPAPAIFSSIWWKPQIRNSTVKMKPVQRVASVHIITVMRQCSDNLVLVGSGIVFKD